MYYISTHKRCKYNSEKYIYFSIYSIKRKNALFEVLSYGYPMGMLWLSYGINSQIELFGTVGECIEDGTGSFFESVKAKLP